MHSKDYIPEFKSLFKTEMKDLIVFKRNCGNVYGRANICMMKLMDNFFIESKLNDKEITQEVYDNWMKTIKTNTSSTRLRYHSAMSVFCEYLRMNSYENIIQPESLHAKYKSQFIPYIFNDNEINEMFNQMINELNKNSNNKNYKDFYVLICLYYGCGLRLMEALNLRAGNYDIKSKIITITESKNNKERIIRLFDVYV